MLMLGTHTQVTIATHLPLTLSLALWLGAVTLPYTYPKGKGVPRDSYLPVSTRTPSGVLRMLRQREGRAAVVVLSHMPSATLAPSPIFFIQTHTPVREK